MELLASSDVGTLGRLEVEFLNRTIEFSHLRTNTFASFLPPVSMSSEKGSPNG